MNPTNVFIYVAICLTFVKGQVPGLRFLLYTKSNKILAKELKANDLSTLSSSKFVKNRPVKFLTHGFTSNYLVEFPQDMKNTYLGQTGDYNVIAVDWRVLAQAPYESAARNVTIVGREIAKLIVVLINNGYSKLTDFHHIGHSLGGQVGAFISSNLGSGNKLKRVTGLDPGRPGFENSVPAGNRLDPTDADFVDVITTSCGVFCNNETPDPPRGTVDFFANGGLHQPGCEAADMASGGLCSHSRAYKFYEESITTTTKGFKSYKCRNSADYPASCDLSQSALMGEYVSTAARGVYYLQTNAQSPFAKG